MKKLTLKLDDLSVESFNTAPTQPDARGTVHGNSAGHTCEGTCQYECGASMEDTCYGRNTCDGYRTCGVWGGYGDVELQIC